MRWFASLTAVGAILGSLSLAESLCAQSLTEHAAAAAGATVGTAAGKPLSRALTTIFGAADNTTATAAGTKPAPAKTAPKTTVTKSSAAQAPAASPAGSTGKADADSTEKAEDATGKTPKMSQAGTDKVYGSHARTGKPVAKRPEAETASFAPAAAPEPGVSAPMQPPAPKEPSIEQLSSIQVGASAHEVVALLGQPASHVSIPDDDGHLRESFQYWAQGQPLGTIRLDNGQVVKVELRPY